ncbi:MAG: hypothetical protein Q7T82_20415 [Armatimonadota bacterium]|nr:hypothetical protein [Armatimonadota bacterium]
MRSVRDRELSKPQWLLLLTCLPLILCLAVAYLIIYLLYAFLLHLAVRLFWSARGIRILYVYSNSPDWQEHIENEILPRLPQGTILLNWSDRKTWRWFGLSVILFRHFGGHREFNPMAVVFRPFRRTRVFRFFKAFRDLKHGKPGLLNRLEADFFEELRR